MTRMKIGDWRTKIDAIDTTLVHLLNVRAAFALEVGRLKGQRGMALRVPQREREILGRLKQLNPGPLDERAIEKIYAAILSESIRIQAEHGFGTVKVEGAVARPRARRHLASRRRKAGTE